VIEHLKHISRETGCYKLILDCSQDNVKFYERCGLKVKELQVWPLERYNTRYERCCLKVEELLV
jgi:hypothetical protein